MCIRDRPYYFRQFQFIGGMKVGEPSADGRGSAPPELAKQQAQAGSDAAPATPPPLGAQSTFIPVSYTHLDVYKRQLSYRCTDGAAV